ncbi:MAG: aminotransferase class V-fold PLP-dependent enzyme, partial [Acidobacteriota bacterium]
PRTAIGRGGPQAPTAAPGRLPASAQLPPVGIPMELLHKAYSLDPKITYLNHASMGTMPRIVQRAHRAYLSTCELNPWLYMWSDAWSEALARTRAEAGALLGCNPERLAITRNATEGFHMLAQGLKLGPGDEVLFSNLNHVGASAPFQTQALRQGFRARRFQIDLTRIPWMFNDDIIEAHVRAIRPSTRVLVLPHIDNIVGLRHPITAIARAARGAGVRWVLIDGAQTAGMLPLRLDALEIDAYVTSGHKWLQGPKGTGLLYLRPRLQHELRPMFTTWGQERWQGTVRQFEDFGARDLPGVLALGDAIAFQRRFDLAVVDRHRRALWRHVRDRAKSTVSLRWCSSTAWDRGGAIATIGLRERASAAIAGKLFKEHGFVLRPFTTEALGTLLRLSPNLANTVEQLDNLLERLQAT